MTPKDFCKLIYNACKNIDISPIFIIAQLALESGWGKKIIGKFNMAGITANKDYKGKTIMVRTKEVFNTPDVKFAPPIVVHSITKRKDGKYLYDLDRPFRDYESMEEFLIDYTKIFQQDHFLHAWPFRHDPIKFVTELQSKKEKYATAPNYVQVMTPIFKTVQKYLA